MAQISSVISWLGLSSIKKSFGLARAGKILRKDFRLKKLHESYQGAGKKECALCSDQKPLC